MIYAFYIDDKKKEYHQFDVSNNEYKTFEEMPKFRNDALLIVYGQTFPTRAKIWDITTVEKIIYFPGPKNIARLNIKYFNAYTRASKINMFLKNMLRIYKKQVAEISQLNLKKAVEFECDMVGSIGFINSKKLLINDTFFELYEKVRESYSKKNLLSRKEIIEICNDNKYDLFKKGKWHLSHQNLLSTGDKKLESYVKAAEIAGRLKYMQPFYDKLVDINHNVYGTITGRISTTNPNIQGIQKEWIAGNIYSFDFTAFEVMIYLSLYKPGIIDKYNDSGEKDLYMFLFNLFTKNRAKEEYRDKFKFLTIMILYGGTKKDCTYRFDEFGEKLYDKISFHLGIEKVKESLVNHIKRTGRYLINEDLDYTICDRNSFLFFRQAPLAKEISRKYKDELKEEYWSSDDRIFLSRKIYHDKLTYEKGIVEETISLFETITKLALNYHIQGIGAQVIKTVAKKLLYRIKSQILILRHDEVLIDINNDNDIEITPAIMKDVFWSYFKTKINVKTTKI